MMAKYFRHVIRNGEWLSGPAGHQQLLADFHDFDELGGIGIKVHHVAGVLSQPDVPVFMATPTSACASAGASLVHNRQSSPPAFPSLVRA
jgi:hypothetical protein